jgi:acetate---CoA ligase (ADP-forming) subunit beta
MHISLFQKEKMLNLLDSFEQLKGLPIAKFKVIESEQDLDNFSFPCWLKVSLSEHKTEFSAVKKCINLEVAKKNFKEMRKKFTENIIAQEQVEGIEMILGIKEDAAFGKLLMIGFGGVFTEVVKDISFRALPVDKKEIEASLKELKLYPALTSRKKFATDKFISLAEKISKLPIREADFNPVILNEHDAIIVDSRIEL